MGTTRYSVRLKEDVPVRLVVMDTVPGVAPDGIPLYYGVMTREQFEEFVKPTIKAAQAAGEYVILVSHHPSANFNKPYPGCSVKTCEFRRYVASRPNVIAHLAGHEHRHQVTRVSGPYPYLEIETASIIDYPQEGRILDIFYDEETQTLRLESTIFSHMEDPSRLSSESFRRATIDIWQNGKGGMPDIDVDAVFADACKAYGMQFAGWEPLGPPEERRGRPEDRDFTAQFRRPDIR